MLGLDKLIYSVVLILPVHMCVYVYDLGRLFVQVTLCDGDGKR